MNAEGEIRPLRPEEFLPHMELIFTMPPDLSRIIPGRARRQHRKALVKSPSSTRRHSERLIELAASLGAEILSLGPRILRTETAPLAALSAILYEKGDWEL